MSMYNMVMGENPLGKPLVALLVARQELLVGRYRDAWMESSGELLLIRVHTRMGGGNRDDYEDSIENMRAHPWYLTDEDDDFDYTYADFWFVVDLVWVREWLISDGDVDDELADETIAMLVESAVPRVDMGARWMEAIDALKSD